jgi:hypothetical protein
MKKSKIIPLKTDQLIDNKTVKKITEGLDHLNDIPVHIPNQIWFEQFVLEQQRKAKIKWHREVFLFCILALIILSGVTFSLYRNPIIFMALQGVVILSILLYVVIYSFKKVTNHAG